MPLKLSEKRVRNRSLCTLYTPPPYPGFSATLGPIIPTNGHRKFSWQPQSHTDILVKSRTCASSGNILDAPVLSQSYSDTFFAKLQNGSPSWRSVNGSCSTLITPESPYRRSKSRSPGVSSHLARFNLSSPIEPDDIIHTNGVETTFAVTNGTSNHTYRIEEVRSPYVIDCQPFPNNIHSLRDRRLTNRSQPSNSSGYASHCSESSEPEERHISLGEAMGVPPIAVVMRARPHSRVQRQRMFEKRRQSVPANLRDIYSDEIVRVLAQDGICLPCGTVNLESPGAAECGISHESNVIELSREYSQAQAQQAKQRHKMGTIAEIDHADELNKMLETCKDPEEKKAIRSRIIELRRIDREKMTKRLSQLENSSQQRIKDKVSEGNRLRERTLAAYDELQKTGKLNIDTYKGDKKDITQRSGKENSRPSGTKSGPSSPTGRADEARRISSKPAAVGGIASLSTSTSSGGVKTYVSSMATTKGNMFKQMDKVGSNGTTSPAITKPASKKDALVRWCAYKTKEYPNINIANMSSSWADGMSFCALIHHFHPDSFDFEKLEPNNRKYNLSLAFKTAEDRADIVPLLEVEDMLEMGDRPDWKCVFTYVQSFYQRFKDED